MTWISIADVGSPTDGQADVAESIGRVGADLAAGTINQRFAAIESVLSWDSSCVLRGQTASGPAFFKAALDTPLFANEAPDYRSGARHTSIDSWQPAASTGGWDACVAHPLFDVIAIRHEDDEAIQARLRMACLAEWRGFCSGEMLRRGGDSPSH